MSSPSTALAPTPATHTGPTLVYVSDGALYVARSGEKPLRVDSAFARQVNERAAAIERKHAWKGKGRTGPYRSMVWGLGEQGDTSSHHVSISGVCLDGQRLLYAQQSGRVSGVFRIDVSHARPGEDERRLFHTTDLSVQDLGGVEQPQAADRCVRGSVRRTPRTRTWSILKSRKKPPKWVLSHELVRCKRDGRPEVSARGVLAFDLMPGGALLCTNGRAVFVLDEKLERQELLRAKEVTALRVVSASLPMRVGTTGDWASSRPARRPCCDPSSTARRRGCRSRQRCPPAPAASRAWGRSAAARSDSK